MDGIERIKVLASEIIDDDLKKITDYLITREDMNEKYLNEEKSIKQMVNFINNTAKKELSKKGKSGFVGQFISDEVVFGWAIHYWDESNESLGLNKKETEVESAKELTEDSSEKDEKVEKIVPVKNDKPKWVAEGQLTLFDGLYQESSSETV